MIVQPCGGAIHTPTGLVLAGEIQVPKVSIIHFEGESGVREVIEEYHRKMCHEHYGDGMLPHASAAPPRRLTLSPLPIHHVRMPQNRRFFNAILDPFKDKIK